jgi:hypothetical protein
VRLLNPLRYVGQFVPVKGRGGKTVGHKFTPLDPVVRKHLITSVLASGAIVTALTGLLATVAGVTISALARDPDFGKFKIGNTRFDFGGGFLQYIRLGARLIYELRHREEWNWTHNPAATATDFAIQKTTPFINYAYGLLSGYEAVSHRPFHPGPAFLKLFIPMVAGDTWEAAQEHGLLSPVTALAGGVSVVGGGVQTYAPKPVYNPGMPKGEYDKLLKSIERANRQLEARPLRTAGAP